VRPITCCAGEVTLPRLIPASDMQQLLPHLDAASQALARELYVLDENVWAAAEQCYSLPPSADSKAEPAFVLQGLGQVLNFSEKADALQKSMQAAACARWDLTCDDSGRFAIAIVLPLAAFAARRVQPLCCSRDLLAASTTSSTPYAPSRPAKSCD
jgi:hypothetical protein